MQGIFLFLIYIVLFTFGLAKPFAMALGYVWTDLFTPQDVDPALLGRFPVSLVMGAGTAVSYLLFGSKDRPPLSGTTCLLIAFGGWMSMTLLWAEVPEYAWLKWDWAVKTVLFTALFPLFFRSRIQIEALLLTMILSLGGLLCPVGVKTLMTGGGYQLDYLVPIVVGTGAGLGEGITLALYAVLAVPLIISVIRHSVILPWYRPRIIGCTIVIICCVAAALGTYARTGLVSLVVLGTLLLLQAKRRMVLGTVMALFGLCLLPVVGPAWLNRMDTISASEPSAAGRVDAWIWTLDYVGDHPLGGSFDAYRINAPAMEAISDGRVTIAKATHSIYFEVLSETGIIGFSIWIIILLAFYRNMWRLVKKTKQQKELEWLNVLTKMCLISMTIFVVGGAFLSVAFLPISYYLIAIGQCSSAYYRSWAKSNEPRARLFAAKESHIAWPPQRIRPQTLA